MKYEHENHYMSMQVLLHLHEDNYDETHEHKIVLVCKQVCIVIVYSCLQDSYICRYDEVFLYVFICFYAWGLTMYGNQGRELTDQTPWNRWSGVEKKDGL